MLLVSRAKAALDADHSQHNAHESERDFLHANTEHFIITAEHAWAQSEGRASAPQYRRIQPAAIHLPRLSPAPTTRLQP